MGDPRLATVGHGRRILERTVEVGLQILSVLEQQAKHESES